MKEVSLFRFKGEPTTLQAGDSIMFEGGNVPGIRFGRDGVMMAADFSPSFERLDEGGREAIAGLFASSHGLDLAPAEGVGCEWPMYVFVGLP
jgi:hypothetical protein